MNNRVLTRFPILLHAICGSTLRLPPDGFVSKQSNCVFDKQPLRHSCAAVPQLRQHIKSNFSPTIEFTIHFLSLVLSNQRTLVCLKFTLHNDLQIPFVIEEVHR
jgi:hypothetical protein